ncbi:MAG: low specificity L-threonine aldolase [Myxococcales bacterium]|nr:low specificity L-threonine aldolase [Myxococcales bacterium]MCB9733100.1 low specificity L-threonine aldolase [Deltaproteobacteria bacterium]
MRSVDLRSDTVTRPSAAMRRAMAEADVGDACYGEDPLVNRLEATIAERLGKEAAIFVPTGTMSNQLGLGVHTRPGDAVVCHERAHIAMWEGAGGAANAGVQLVTVASASGLPSVEALAAATPPSGAKAPRARVLALENTHNAAGGIPFSPEELAPATAWAKARGMACHLDGARLFNAATACEVRADAIAAPFDSVSVCFSKGLGAPVGSAFVTSRALREEADRMRHRLGGGWRQAGILAAAALYALEEHVPRLAVDHARAARIAEAMVRCGVARPTHAVRTNLVCFAVDAAWGTARALQDRLAERGVLLYDTGPQTGRLVTHRDLDDDDVAYVVAAFEALG